MGGELRERSSVEVAVSTTTVSNTDSDDATGDNAVQNEMHPLVAACERLLAAADLSDDGSFQVAASEDDDADGMIGAIVEPDNTVGSLLDLSREIDSLGKLQAQLQQMERDLAETPSIASPPLALLDSTTTTVTATTTPQKASSASAPVIGLLDSTCTIVENPNGAGGFRPIRGLAARRLVRVPCDGEPRTKEGRPRLPFTLSGGAAEGRLISVDRVRHADLVGLLRPADLILAIDSIPLAGSLLSHAQSFLERMVDERDQLAVEVVAPESGVPVELGQILQDNEWASLHALVRHNLYRCSVPYTTRSPRPGEVDGEHYRFVSASDFETLAKAGAFIESGRFKGHHYGTPRPKEEEQEERPNWNGKKRRHKCSDENEPLAEDAKEGDGQEEERMAAGDGLPLPPNWEIGYTDYGEKYFIDHNTGSTQWADPRELPQGWERVDDPVYGIFYVDHVNKRTQYERPNGGGGGGGGGGGATIGNGTAVRQNGGGGTTRGIMQNGGANKPTTASAASTGRRLHNPPILFTRDPSQLAGDMISTRIVKGAKGLGFTLIGNDASSRGDEFIQIKTILPYGPAASDGILQPGDILVYVNNNCVLGATQAEACRIFLAIPVGEAVTLQVCRGYPLLLDPSSRIVTENVYSTGGRARDLFEIEIVKGPDGFGFTIAESVQGQKVKKIVHGERCANLAEGDIILEFDGQNVRSIGHTHLVEMLRDCAVGHRGRLLVRRASPRQNARSRTPTAAFRYGEQRRTPLPASVQAPRSKTPAPVGSVVPNGGPTRYVSSSSGMPNSASTLGFGAATPNYMPLSAMTGGAGPLDGHQLITVNLIRKPQGFGFRLLGGAETNTYLTVGQIVPAGAAADDGRMREGDEIVEIDGHPVEGALHRDAVQLIERAAAAKHIKLLIRRLAPPTQHNGSFTLSSEMVRSQSVPQAVHQAATAAASEYDVVLTRSEHEGFGFVIISSTARDASTIGEILPGSPAARSGRLAVGDRVVAVNGRDIGRMLHADVVNLIKQSGLAVRLTIAVLPGDQDVVQDGRGGGGLIGRRPPDYRPNFHHGNGGDFGGAPSTSYKVQQQHAASPSQDDTAGDLISVELARGARGFGFSIRGGHEFSAMPLFMLRIAEDGPAEADGRLRVGDQLIEINGRSTRGMTHDQAIQLIKERATVRLLVRRRQLP